MYRIIGQPINFRNIGTSNLVIPPPSEESIRISKICGFGLKYGYAAAVAAFEISKSTYYNYLKLYKISQEFSIKLELKSKRPHNLRKPNWDKRITCFIRKMREDHANIGKDKIKYYLGFHA